MQDNYVYMQDNNIYMQEIVYAFSLLVNRYLRPWVRILPSAEEDNLSPLDSNMACLCQSIEINNNKYVYLIMYTSIFEYVYMYT